MFSLSVHHKRDWVGRLDVYMDNLPSRKYVIWKMSTRKSLDTKIIWTHRCKDLDVTPVSLKLKCPIRTNRAQSIIKRAEKKLLRERITVVSNKIGNLESKRHVINNDLETLLNPEVKSRVYFHINKSRQSENNKCKTRQIRKLERLTEKSKSQSSPLKSMTV